MSIGVYTSIEIENLMPLELFIMSFEGILRELIFDQPWENKKASKVIRTYIDVGGFSGYSESVTRGVINDKDLIRHVIRDISGNGYISWRKIAMSIDFVARIAREIEEEIIGEEEVSSREEEMIGEEEVSSREEEEIIGEEGVSSREEEEIGEEGEEISSREEEIIGEEGEEINNTPIEEVSSREEKEINNTVKEEIFTEGRKILEKTYSEWIRNNGGWESARFITKFEEDGKDTLLVVLFFAVTTLSLFMFYLKPNLDKLRR